MYWTIEHIHCIDNSSGIVHWHLPVPLEDNAHVHDSDTIFMYAGYAFFFFILRPDILTICKKTMYCDSRRDVRWRVLNKILQRNVMWLLIIIWFSIVTTKKKKTVYSKTCPRRATTSAEAAVIQPALDGDMFGVGGLGTPVGRGGSTSGVGRVQPMKLETALEAANRQVLAAENAVASSQTSEEFGKATDNLDLAVARLERIANCAKRCALVAYSLSTTSLDISPAPAVNRDNKRQRMETQINAQPIAPRIEESVQQVQQDEAPTQAQEQQNIDEALE